MDADRAGSCCLVRIWQCIKRHITGESGAVDRHLHLDGHFSVHLGSVFLLLKSLCVQLLINEKEVREQKEGLGSLFVPVEQ